MECATIYYDRMHYFPMHLHPDRYTFSYIISGSANLVCNNSEFVLKPDTLVIIPPYVAHQTLIKHFFHYNVIRVPVPFSFNNLNNNQLGLTIIENSTLYKNHFNYWFDLIRANMAEGTEIPDVFKHFLTGQGSSLTKSEVLIKKSIMHLEKNYNRTLPVEELSDLVHLSESHFQRLFKKTIGISPSRYLQNLRIEKAKEYIYIRDRNSFTDIAYDTGFFDQSHFNKYFKINVGMIPKRYADLVKNDRILQF
ncbi:helix-turn-helix domain-containing protein [Leptobacterium flavescens]|uniref:Helix-turn-helix domain-containing protein n=1 Tax=Leptobacterium flavescens TaxID=472055 RepID=A0A6P0URP1_9FLAO|nr:AraC family transcriptional regulator [Leptobacterium flavescens]NER13533.1 helix-turn-helix domain-containing protein [Leptobacterium flavescens]